MSARTLVEFVLAASERATAGRPAVESSGETLDYTALVAGARSIASTLQEHGIGRGDRVGLWMDKSPRGVQALLGVMLAGSAYVPLDPRAPWRRTRAIAEDCGLAAFVVDRSHLESTPHVLEGLATRLVIADGGDADRPAAGALASRLVSLADALSRPPADLPFPDASELAYILYTSGSTGVPKGVAHTHASGLAFARWVQERFAIRSDDVFSSHAPFHFDLSISDLYAALGSGARIRLISPTEGMLAPYLVSKIPEWGITVWYSVPSVLVAMLDAGALEAHGMGNVRLLFFAGEVFPTPQLRRLRRALPQVPLFNLFGPTETNVCTYYEVPAELPEDSNAPIPIGRTCEHMETFVLDDDGRVVGVGVEGTLWVKGPNLLHSYWNDPERTQATLRPDPRGLPGSAYCTGDRVALLPDGDYRFLGRRDHMVKVRGYRVELGEIESALAAHPGVLEAVAVPVPDPTAGTRIVAVVQPRTDIELEAAGLQAHCRQLLPLYMIPERIDFRSSLPRTSTGKIDRTTLRLEWAEKEAR